MTGRLALVLMFALTACDNQQCKADILPVDGWGPPLECFSGSISTRAIAGKLYKVCQCHGVPADAGADAQ